MTKKEEVKMKNIFYISFLFLCVLLSYTCRKQDCSQYEITPQEESFIMYKIGDKFIFKNYTNGLIDTLLVYNSGYYTKEYDVCKDSKVAKWALIYFPPIVQISIFCGHKSSPNFDIGNIKYEVNVPPQAMTINSTTYSDVYSVAIDSNTITNTTTPWKIDYSRSAGFVRFYLKNGVIWSKL